MPLSEGRRNPSSTTPCTFTVASLNRVIPRLSCRSHFERAAIESARRVQMLLEPQQVFGKGLAVSRLGPPGVSDTVRRFKRTAPDT